MTNFPKVGKFPVHVLLPLGDLLFEIVCRRSLGKILPWRQPEMFDPLAMKNGEVW